MKQKQYEAATKVAPLSSAAWEALTAFHIRHRHFADAASAAEQGLKAAPDNATLTALRSNAQSLAGLGDAGEFGNLIGALWRTPRDSGAAEMLAAIVAGRNAKLTPSEMARKISEIADRHRENLALTAQAIKSLVLAGESDGALEKAVQFAAANPNEPGTHQILATLYMSRGDWAKAESGTALLWRKFSISQPDGSRPGPGHGFTFASPSRTWPERSTF